LSLRAVSPQVLNINCVFYDESEYGCKISQMTVADNPNATVIVGGQHLPGHTNSSEVFKLSTRSFRLLFRSSLSRSLQLISINNNQNLKSIEVNAFVGANNVWEVNLSDNGIELIDENAFMGLFAVRNLNLSSNRIIQLSADVFGSLPKLQFITVCQNQLTSLNGRIFQNNH
jgi:Leucine-rich repeat (LRR) protein